MTYHLAPHPQYGFLQVYPTPSDKEISDYYAQEFYDSNYSGVNDSQLSIIESDRDFYIGHYRDILSSLTELLEKPNSALNLLDIGCGWCQALQYWKSCGVNCSGIDPAKEAVEHGISLGINVRCTDIQKLNVFDNKFSAVTLMNVLEHIANPEDTILQIRNNLIETGGILVVDVPNEFNPFQLAAQATFDLPEWWVAPPAHLNYFSGSSLTALLNENGFEVLFLEASFPMELFMLMGENYVENPSLGRLCHKRRVEFELNMRKLNKTSELRAFYRALASAGLGRQVMAFARAI